MYFVIPFKCDLNLAILSVLKNELHLWIPLPFAFHMNIHWCGRLPWFGRSFLPLSFGFSLVGVVCLCGRLALDCKRQSQSCFQLPVKAYRTVCCVKITQQVKL